MKPTSKMKDVLSEIMTLPFDQRIEAINECRKLLHSISPFNKEPIDLVLWVKGEEVYANDYNPNSVASPEMELLKLSIEADGYTQPIVSMTTDEGREEIGRAHV